MSLTIIICEFLYELIAVNICKYYRNFYGEINYIKL